MKRAVLLLLPLLSLSVPVSVLACSCVPQTPTEVLQQADVVFVGLVLRSDLVEPVEGVPMREIEFQAFKYWKGELEPFRTVVVSAAGTSCDIDFQRGTEYLIYAKWSDASGELTTFMCWRNPPAATADEDLAELGEPDLVPAAPATWGRLKALYSREP